MTTLPAIAFFGRRNVVKVAAKAGQLTHIVSVMVSSLFIIRVDKLFCGLSKQNLMKYQTVLKDFLLSFLMLAQVTSSNAIISANVLSI